MARVLLRVLSQTEILRKNRRSPREQAAFFRLLDALASFLPDIYQQMA